MLGAQLPRGPATHRGLCLGRPQVRLCTLESPCWGVGEVALTWSQVQLVENLELLRQVPVVHPTCGERPAGRQAGRRAREPHGQATFESSSSRGLQRDAPHCPTLSLERPRGEHQASGLLLLGACRPSLQQQTEGGEGRVGKAHITYLCGKTALLYQGLRALGCPRLAMVGRLAGTGTWKFPQKGP